MDSITPQKPLQYPQKSKPGALNPNWRGGKLTKLCQHCGSQFQVIPSRINAKFCSLKCCNKSDEHRQCVSKGTPVGCKGRRTTYAVIKCGWCSTEFEVQPSLAGVKKFCCKECQFKWRGVHHSGENNPNWQGGMRKDYPWNWRILSKKIMARDGYACWNPACLCEDDKLVVHHIDYNKKNLDEANLITVCSSCNSRANYSRVEWKAIYTGVQRHRFAAGLLFPPHPGGVILNWGKQPK